MIQSLKTNSSDNLPPLDFLRGNYNRDSPGGSFCSSAVIPSLPLAMKWLRDCVRENPSIKLQVRILLLLEMISLIFIWKCSSHSMPSVKFIVSPRTVTIR